MKFKCYLLTAITLLFFTQTLLWAKDESTTNATPQVVDTGKVLVEYSQFIRDETAIHQAFLEGVYDKLVKGIGVILIGFGAVLTWLNWKTKKDIDMQVNRRIDSMAKVAIDDKLKAFDDQLQSVRGNLDAQVKTLRDSMDEQLKDINQVMFAPEHRVRATAERILKTSERKKRILWVDDYPENNDVPGEILRSNGVEITTALSTEEALKEIEHQSFDLIISDMGRGTNSSAGLDLLKALRDKNSKKPIIIFCSSKAAARYGSQAQKLGAVAVTSGFASLLDHAFGVLNLNEKPS